MPIDPSIPLRGRPPQDSTEAMGRMMTLRSLMNQQELHGLQAQQLRKGIADEQTLADIYRGAVNPDGTVNQTSVLTSAAQRGLGAKIPSIREGFLKVDKEEADIKNKKATTAKTELDTMKEKLNIAGGMISSLLATPNVTADHIVATVSSLVNRGLIPQDEGAQMIRQIPTNNPTALRQWLIQKGMEVMDADKRLTALTPKIEYKDTGKTMMPVDVNALTNPTPQALTKTTTPGEDQSALVQIRGQDVSAQTARRGQDMTDKRDREGVQYMETPDGVVALPSKAVPGTVSKAAPVLAPGGGMKPLMGKGASLTEDQGKATAWLQQASNAYTNMQKVLKVNPDAATPGVGDAVAAIPGGGAVGNYLRSTDRQKFNQAASSLSEALLRAATGAGINQHEAEQKVRELTPQWGDREGTIKQKLDSIPGFIEGLKVRAGPGARKVPGTPAAATPAPGALGSGSVDFKVPNDIDNILKKYGG